MGHFFLINYGIGSWLNRFQGAAIHIDELLNLRNNSDIQVYLDDLPEGLKNAYDRVWQTIQRKRGRAKVIAQRTFQWLLCS